MYEFPDFPAPYGNFAKSEVYIQRERERRRGGGGINA
jgi:hypothetical protein